MHLKVKSKKKKQYKPVVRQQVSFTAMQELLASPEFPIASSIRASYADALKKALMDMSSDEVNNRASWNLLVDIINLMQTFVLSEICQDEEDLITDARNIMIAAGREFKATGRMKLAESDLSIVRGVSDDFLYVVSEVSHRTFVQHYRMTKSRITHQSESNGYEVIRL